MSTAFLCVQFRNLLPSEQLLLFARALWSDLQQRVLTTTLGDATLSITQMASEITRFEVELRVANSPHRARARDADALLAIERVFQDWGARTQPPLRVGDTGLLGDPDTLPGTEWQSDPAGR